MKKIITRVLSTIIAASSVFASAGGGLFPSPLDACAEGNAATYDSSDLQPGQYIVPLLRNKIDQMNLAVVSTKADQSNKFLGCALLTIDENHNQSLTIGIEHWSFYDEFAVLNQEYTDDYNNLGYSINAFPDGFFLSENPLTYMIESSSNTEQDENGTNITVYNYNCKADNQKAKEAYMEGGYPIAKNCDEYFDFHPQIAYDKESNYDIAYMTIPLKDYQDRVYVYSWFNCPNSGSTSIDKLFDSSVIYLDLNDIEPYSEIESKIETGTISYSIDCASSSTSKGIQYYNAYKTIRPKIEGLFNKRDSAGELLNSITKSDDGYIAKFFIDTEKFTDVSDFQILIPFDENYYQYKESSVSAGLRTYNHVNWSLKNYETLPILADDSGNPYVEINFTNDIELKLGRVMQIKLGKKQYWFNFRLSAKELGEENTVSVTDESNGNIISVTASTKYLPIGSELSFEKNPESFNRGEGFDNELDSSYYDQESTVWYKCVAKYQGEILDVRGATVTINLSNKIEPDYVEVINESGGSAWTTTEGNSTSTSFQNGVFTTNNAILSKYAFAFIKFADRVNPENLEDGVYSTNIRFMHSIYPTRFSMADKALTREAYIVHRDGVNYLYFNAHDLMMDGIEAYMAEIIAADNETHAPIDDSIQYTSYATCYDGTYNTSYGLLYNAIYEPITEFACITGGVLQLTSKSYISDKNAYNICVTSAIMAGIGGLDYDTIIANNKAGRGLHVTLTLSDVERVDYTEDDIKNMELYRFQSTALLRKIKQAEINYNIGENTVFDSTAFADAYAVYNKADATSQEIEAAINALDSVSTEVVPSAKVTGYSLTAKEDFGLHLFVNLGYDAQNDANAAVKFNIGGTERTIAVSDATFVKGKGYEFKLDVPAKAMFDEITAEVVLSDGAEVIGDANLGTYSVAGYLNDYLADSTKTELDALAQATLTYGAYADKFFNGSTDATLADVSAVTIDNVAQYKHNINVAEEGIEFIGAALTLESKTSVKLYFKVDEDNLYDITDFDFTVNGNKAEPERNGDYYYITVPKLTAGELAKAQTFTVNDAEFSYSPFSYVYAALADSDAEKEADLINLVKALYLYGVEAGKVA